MNCQKCNQPLEAGAAFCGNCGQAIAQLPAQPVISQAPVPTIPVPDALPPPAGVVSSPTPVQSVAQPAVVAAASPIAQVYANHVPMAGAQTPLYPGGLAQPMVAGGAMAVSGIPAYAVPVAGQQSSNTKALLSLVFGIAGIGGALFIPLLGLGLGVAGIVLASMSRHSTKRGMSTAGLIVSIVAIVVGLASWAYVISQDPRFNHKAATTSDPAISGSVTTASSVNTPCYSVSFADTLHIDNASGSCDMSVYNGATIDQSNDAYKVYGSAVSELTDSNFVAEAKKGIESDMKQTLPSFSISDETSGTFAGSPAYRVTADNGQGVSVMEAAALHETSNGDNFFVFVHAVSGDTVNLDSLESGWEWQ